MTSPTADVPRPAAALAELPLTLVALEGSTVLADRRFPPGASVSVGSNSRNDLVFPERFELPTYRLLTRGSLLHLAKPFYVQTLIWEGELAVPLKGYVRALLRTHPSLAEPVPLASERFLIRYATGLALLGRFGAT
jgi:hypothetical protein